MTPPQNLEAEESVLGSLLLSTRAFEEVTDILEPHDFYRESHSTIYSAALAMYLDGEPVDAVTLADRLTKIGQLDRVGGPSRISELAALVPATSNVVHYARIVAKESARRALVRAGQLIAQLGTEGQGDSTELIAQAESHLSEATALRSSSPTASITEGLDELIAERREAYQNNVPILGHRTGLNGLDEVLLGLWPGQLVICAARPGQGKSALALTIAENFADREDPALIHSLEMSRFELQIRSLARAARVDGKRIQTGLLREQDAEKLPMAIKAIKDREGRLFVDDTANVTLPQVKANATRLHRQVGLRLLVVDYLQLMQGVGDNRTEQIGSISRGLKQLARTLDIPILALSQMNRGIESRNDKRPTLADLRDSGSLEQDADVVMFLHDEAAYDTSKESQGDIEVIVEKNRKGERGSVKMLFLRRFTTFQDPSRHPRSESEAA